MLQFILSVFTYELKSSLLESQVTIYPVECKNKKLAINNTEVVLDSDSTSQIKIKRMGTKQYLILIDGMTICAEKIKKGSKIRTCKPKDKYKYWNIKKSDKNRGYSIKQADRSFFRQFCLTHDPSCKTKLQLNKCDNSDYKNQLFDIKGGCNNKNPKDLSNNLDCGQGNPDNGTYNNIYGTQNGLQNGTQNGLNIKIKKSKIRRNVHCEDVNGPNFSVVNQYGQKNADC